MCAQRRNWFIRFLLWMWEDFPPAPKDNSAPGDPMVSSIADSLLRVDALRKRVADLESRLAYAHRQIEDKGRLVAFYDARLHARHASRDTVVAALRRVRDHHLPGWKMNANGMCPLCVNSRIFEEAENLLGAMEFSTVPLPEETSDDAQRHEQSS